MFVFCAYISAPPINIFPIHHALYFIKVVFRSGSDTESAPALKSLAGSARHCRENSTPPLSYILLPIQAPFLHPPSYSGPFPTSSFLFRPLSYILLPIQAHLFRLSRSHHLLYLALNRLEFYSCQFLGLFLGLFNPFFPLQFSLPAFFSLSLPPVNSLHRHIFFFPNFPSYTYVLSSAGAILPDVRTEYQFLFSHQPSSST
jgi:hypothetical protein